MNDQTELRKHLLELLEGKSAHIAIEAALRGFPINLINERCESSPHTAWELLEHIRIAQNDILEFSRNSRHVSPDFPDGYWSKAVGGKPANKPLVSLRTSSPIHRTIRMVSRCG